MGQNTTGSITGRLTDISGAVIPEATGDGDEPGDVHDSTWCRRTPSGVFTVTLLLPGRYEVTASKDGFRRAVQSGITLDVAQTVRTDLTLQVGNTSETVQVTCGRVDARHRQCGGGAGGGSQAGERVAAERA